MVVLCRNCLWYSEKYILSWYSVLEISNACWVRQGLLSVVGLMCAVGMADNMSDWYPPLLVSVLQLILNGQKLVALCSDNIKVIRIMCIYIYCIMCERMKGYNSSINTIMCEVRDIELRLGIYSYRMLE